MTALSNRLHGVGFIVLALLSIAVALNPWATLGAAFLIAAAVSVPDQLPKLGFFVIAALVPMDAVSYLGDTPPDRFLATGASLSIVKIVFLPALGLMLWQKAVKREPIARHGQYLLAAGLMAAVVFSYFINPPNYRSFTVLRRFMSMALLFVLGVNVLKTERDIAALLVIIPFSCIVSAGSFMIQMAMTGGLHNLARLALAQGTARLVGLQNYAEGPSFGRMLLVAFFIVLRFAWRYKGWQRWLLVAVSGFLLFSIIGTLARGSIVALVVALAYGAYRFRHKINMQWVALTVVLLAIVVIPLIPQAFYTRFEVLFENRIADESAMRRLGSNLISMDLFSRAPLFGFGPGAFTIQYMDMTYRFLRFAPDGYPEVGHGMYLTLASELGLLGLFFMGALIGVTLRDLRRVIRTYDVPSTAFLKCAAEAVELAFISFLVTALFENNHMNKYMWIVFAMAPAMLHMRKQQLAGASPGRRPWTPEEQA